MRVTYKSYICEKLHKFQPGIPIHTDRIAAEIAHAYRTDKKKAAAATAVAVKRIMDDKLIPELRCYQKGIYFLTAITPFGETGINKERLIADKYLLPDIGYETGPGILQQMGLTTQIPRERVLATNAARDCLRTDTKLNVIIRPPKVKVTAANKDYLQLLDVLDLLDKTPVDDDCPYKIIAEHIKKQKLQYEVLLALADSYYDRAVVLRLAHAAKAGGTIK